MNDDKPKSPIDFRDIVTFTGLGLMYIGLLQLLGYGVANAFTGLLLYELATRRP